MVAPKRVEEERKVVMRSLCLRAVVFLFVSAMAANWSVCGDERPLWPPLGERPSLSKEEEAVLIQEWKAAKESNLIARREEVLGKVTSISDGYRRVYFKFKNPALIDMMAEIYRVEYGYWQGFRLKGPEDLKPYEAASCIYGVIKRGEPDEAEMEYTNLVNFLALSTYAPSIIDIVLSEYCDRTIERGEYLKEVTPEGYVRALLDAKLETKGNLVFLHIDFHGQNDVEVSEALPQLGAIFADHPELRASSSAKIAPFVDALKAACIPQDAAKACDMSPRQRWITRALEKLSGK